MRSRKRVKMWLFAIGALALIAGAIGVFAGVRFWRSQAHYQVVFSRSVTGLNVGARVERWGIPIGTVDSIHFSADRAETPVVVDIAVDANAYIPAGVRASLEIDGLTFVKYIDLVDGELGAEGLRAGAEIPGSPGELETVLDQTKAVMTAFSELLAKVDLIAADIQELTGGPNRARIASFLEQADRTAKEAAAAAADVRALTSDLRGNGSRAGTSLRSATRDVDEATELARSAMTDVRDAARDLRAVATDLSTLTRRTGRNLDLLFSRLRSTTTSIQNLVRSLEENPARLLRGSSPPERSIP